MNTSADENEELPELDLRLTQESADELYEHAPCGYCSCLPDGTLVKINQTLLGWLGYERTELVARQGLQQLLTVGGRLHFEMHCTPLLLLQGQVREMSYLLRRKDGSTQPVLLNATLDRDTNGAPLVMRVALFDITDRRRYELELLRAKNLADEQRQQLAKANEELRAKNEQLTRTNQDLDNFVYTASHDLKEPLNNMTGLFAELQRTATFHDPEAAEVVALFEQALQQVLATIEGLAKVVQLERQALPVPTDSVELAPLLNEVVRSLQAQHAGLEQAFQIDVQPAPTVHMSGPSVRSILYNLLSNAVRYAAPGRPLRVQVSSALVNGAPVLTVTDNGRGIDMARHGQELFQLFRRFHPEVPGTGLGLYLVKRLVHQAGGRIEAQSIVNQGAVFQIHWPR
ncbi:PAS domain-containing sensor histidine kinase [Hymenobacter ruber]